jgi:hypothetical protein
MAFKRFEDEAPPFNERLLVVWDEKTKAVWMATRFGSSTAQDPSLVTKRDDEYWITTAGTKILETKQKPIYWDRIPVCE